VTAVDPPDPTSSPPRARVDWVLLAAVVVTVLAWASAFIVIRGVGDAFSPGALALGRMLVGTAALSLLVIGRPWVRPVPRDWVGIALYGVLWFGAYNLLLNLAEQTLDAGTTAMVVNIGPLLIALGAAVFLREGLHRWLLVGLAVAFGGVVLIGIANGAGQASLGIGIVAALGAAITYAAGVLFQKPILRRLPSRQVTFLGAAVGALVCLPFGGHLFDELGAATAGEISGVVYLGLVPTALAFSTWGYALTRMPAGQLGVTTYVVPALVVVAGALVFSEFPAPLAIVGGILCLVGVGLSRRRASARS
jgi:drug/metabolite transporter (DMT)-like permease